MTKNKNRKVLSIVSTTAICLNLLSPSISFGASSEPVFKDIEGHWAQQALMNWVAEGLVKGYDDNTLKPDNPVSRAEFASFVNRTFGYNQGAEIHFQDVDPTAWYANEIATAVKQGYLAGYEDGTMRPNQPVTRQEVASMMSRIKNLEPSQADVLSSFVDAGNFPSWSKQSIAEVVEKHYMGGYPDHTFRPTQSITRAEAITTLNNILTQSVSTATYDKPGTYGGPSDGSQIVNGNVVISVPGVTLQNMTITGDLLLTDGVGEGDVTLRGVVVKGKTTIKGGGPNSIHLSNDSLASVVVNKKEGDVRVEASGTTVIQQVELDSGAKLEEKDLTGAGFTNVTVSDQAAENSLVSFIGAFDNVDVSGQKTTLKLLSGSVAKMNVTSKATGISLFVDQTATVKDLTLDTATTVTGQGKIEHAVASVKNVTFEKKPDSYVNNFVPSGGGGGGGGSTPTPGKTDEQKLLDGESVTGNVELTGRSQTYGPASGQATVTGSVTINAEDVHLRNVRITGDLTVNNMTRENVLLAEFAANHVTVDGTTNVNGGASHTVVFTDSPLHNVVLNKSGVRLSLAGNSSVSNGITVIQSANLDLNTTGTISNLDVQSDISLSGTGGNISSIVVNAPVSININSSAPSLNIANVRVNQSGVHLNVPSGVTVPIDPQEVGS